MNWNWIEEFLLRGKHINTCQISKWVGVKPWQGHALIHLMDTQPLKAVAARMDQEPFLSLFKKSSHYVDEQRAAAKQAMQTVIEQKDEQLDRLDISAEKALLFSERYAPKTGPASTFNPPFDFHFMLFFPAILCLAAIPEIVHLNVLGSGLLFIFTFLVLIIGTVYTDRKIVACWERELQEREVVIQTEQPDTFPELWAQLKPSLLRFLRIALSVVALTTILDYLVGKTLTLGFLMMAIAAAALAMLSAPLLSKEPLYLATRAFTETLLATIHLAIWAQWGGGSLAVVILLEQIFNPTNWKKELGHRRQITRMASGFLGRVAAALILAVTLYWSETLR